MVRLKWVVARWLNRNPNRCWSKLCDWAVFGTWQELFGGDMSFDLQCNDSYYCGKCEVNMNLNQIHKGKCCHLCGRKYPDTVLNIEGWIHHHAKIACLDRKDCKKARKKRRLHGV